MRPDDTRPFFRHTVVEAVILVVVFAGLGLLFNALRPDGIPLRSTPANASAPAVTPVGKPGSGLRVISMDAVGERIRKRHGLVIDARAAIDFAAGHIDGAINRPVERFDNWMPVFFQRYPPQTPIVTYCNDPSCPLAEDLARHLIDVGYTDVVWMKAGFDAWRQAGNPVATGSGPTSKSGG